MSPEEKENELTQHSIRKWKQVLPVLQEQMKETEGAEEFLKECTEKIEEGFDWQVTIDVSGWNIELGYNASLVEFDWE